MLADMGTLTLFFGLTFLVTWAAWLAASALSPGAPAAGAGLPLFYLGVFAPGIVALLVTRRESGPAGLRALLGRLVQWPAGGVRWLVFALGYVAAIKLTAALVHRILLGAWPAFTAQPWILLFAAAVFSTVVGGQVGEELGWRGFALPRLEAKLGLRAGSVLLGAVWAAWHLPLFLIAGTNTTGQSFPFYLAQVTALSIALAWLWHRTERSLLPVMLLHAAINNTKDIVTSVPAVPPGNPFVVYGTPVGWITLALLWIAAAWFLASMPSRFRTAPAHSGGAVPPAS